MTDSDDNLDLPAVFYENPATDEVEQNNKNRSRVGSLRPTAMLYTSGIGSTVDLPHMSVIIQGLEFWEKYYSKLNNPDLVIEGRLLKAVQSHLGPTVKELRQPPWMSSEIDRNEADRIGIPASLFPRWLRCVGCNVLAPPNWSEFNYKNTNPYRPDQAAYFHKGCRGRGNNRLKPMDRPTVPARFLLACINGHLDEFPYIEWVHQASGESWQCSPEVVKPLLEMIESPSNSGPQVKIVCRSCKKSRTMQEATGEKGEEKLPACRGRHPHLSSFEKCNEGTKLMLLGSSNQWFPSTIGLLVMPTLVKQTQSDVNNLVAALPAAIIDAAVALETMPLVLMLISQLGIDVEGITADSLWEGFLSLKSGLEASGLPNKVFDPVDILEPEWNVMQDVTLFGNISERSEFKLESKGCPAELEPVVQQVVAVDRLKKVNAFIGFTRVDPEDRIGDESDRRVKIWRNEAPTWVPATEDRGEGIFLQFNEQLVSDWETGVVASTRWKALRESHERNFKRRMSRSANAVEADSRLPSPRYWILHTLSHILIREMALHSGYGAASLTERIYAWQESDSLAAAAGILISTTSADSEGTLGGLVELSNSDAIVEIFRNGLLSAKHCSSDPLCATKLPVNPEEYLHGSACHFCLFVSETSCENSNRFLDRAMLHSVPGTGIDGLFTQLKLS